MDGMTVDPTETLPVVHLICTRCYFIASFAWLSIKERARRG